MGRFKAEWLDSFRPPVRQKLATLGGEKYAARRFVTEPNPCSPPLGRISRDSELDYE